jgi:hypothetical protein
MEKPWILATIALCEKIASISENPETKIKNYPWFIIQNKCFIYETIINHIFVAIKARKIVHRAILSPLQHPARLWRSKFKRNFLFIGSRPKGAMECGSLAWQKTPRSAALVTQFDIAAKAQASLRTPKASPPTNNMRHWAERRCSREELLEQGG